MNLHWRSVKHAQTASSAYNDQLFITNFSVTGAPTPKGALYAKCFNPFNPTSVFRACCFWIDIEKCSFGRQNKVSYDILRGNVA